MELMLDTIDLTEIAECQSCFPVAGVTSNPSIVKKQGSIDFFPYMRRLRELVGPERSLHVQVLGNTCEQILEDAQTIAAHIGPEVYIKVPATVEGLRAMKALKEKKVLVTATAIYNKTQGLMAVAAGADYIAPYFNRMENMDVDAGRTIRFLRQMIDRDGYGTKILAASFKNVEQMNRALESGAHTVTVQPELLRSAFGQPYIREAVQAFYDDWCSVQPADRLAELV